MLPHNNVDIIISKIIKAVNERSEKIIEYFKINVKKHLTTGYACAKIHFASYGEVSEWFKELVLKTSDPARDQGFESLPLRHFFIFL